MFSSKPAGAQNLSATSSKWLMRLGIGACLILVVFCIYQLQRMDRLAKKFAQKESEWQTRYQGYEEKLRLNENYQKQQLEKISLLEQKSNELQSKQYENDVHLAEFDALKDTDQILLMQIKPLLYQAAQELKFQQNVEQSLFILQDVQQRLTELQNTKWGALYQSIEKDIANLRQADPFDSARWLKKLEELKKSSTQITFTHEPIDMHSPTSKADKSIWLNIREELASLFRIEKIDASKILSAEQAWFYREKIDLYLTQARILIGNKQTQKLADLMLEIEKITAPHILNTPQNKEFLERLAEFKLISQPQKLNMDQSIAALEQFKKD